MKYFKNHYSVIYVNIKFEIIVTYFSNDFKTWLKFQNLTLIKEGDVNIDKIK